MWKNSAISLLLFILILDDKKKAISTHITDDDDDASNQITSSSSSVVDTTSGIGETSIPSSSQYYVSLFAFESVEPGDLGFDVNELIKVEKQDGDWWTGIIVDRNTGKVDDNRRGIFPSNFVGPADPAEILVSFHE